ncbi:MAG: enoyl-CoA hydratase/isomerase family protein [Comamonadaceae bacterium]|nr:MAG: enoyl-CoA hydratase/isomerase family protein [Comamonadaceae bacterium]
MNEFENILLTRDKGVATVMLNRPASRNALSARMAKELCEALAALRADGGVRAIVLTGAGGAFCAGGDVRATHAAGERTVEQRDAVFECFRRLTIALHDMDRPVIAAADGVAFGAGFSLLLLSDIVLLSPQARLCMAFQRIGLVPDCGAMFTLPRWVGLQRAKELIYSAREVHADEALRLGIAMEVQPSEALLPRATELARALCEASPTTLRLSKRGLDASLQSDLETMLTMEGAFQNVALGSDYLSDAASRFANKEPLRFKWPDLAPAQPGSPPS